MAAVVLSLAPAVLHAQTATPAYARIEPWIAFGAALPPPHGTVSSIYSPPFEPLPFESRASQTLAFEPDNSRDVEAGLDVFLTRTLGIRASFSSMRGDVEGQASPYDVTLRYQTRLPPDFQLREFTFSTSRDWPATSGSLRQSGAGVALLVRWRSSRGFGATVSAGPRVERVTGEVRSLGFSNFWLGGAGVLFSQHHRLAAALEPASTWGAAIGADAELPLGRFVSAIVGYRGFVGGTLTTSTRLTAILNPNEILISEPLAVIQTRMPPASVALSTNYGRVVAGVKVRIVHR